ncbi:gamma-type small acid-soluble spore protein [Aquibacillus halophilus]|uniref:Small, acid-soluble spore protein gamma-type n=1 Tax=Aquibacillus halophilus TaxID=930132 RepID=A0A6A8DG80_9BACI|nr:gamma-type small acid-soluble spore protein [Aquibacillus halophilus]MRH44663.1 gamma-type small acid-soluble spore protein [Aquibacillus halophilus]
MAKNNQPNKTVAGTNVQKVRQQNQQAAQGQQANQGQQQFGTEFASETNAQEVRKQNQKSQQKKS